MEITLKKNLKKILIIIILSFNIISCAYAKQQPRVAIIIDDLGNSKDINKLDDIEFPFTVSVFPRLKDSTKSGKELNRRGFEVLVHMPMEPINNMDPGPYAINLDMSERKIIKVLNDNLESVPFAIGINNHMGSRVTQDSRCMRIIMKELKKQGFLFIDSYVINSSICGKISKELDLPVIKRDIFLDNIDNRSYIDKQLKKLMYKALKNGKALAIGHITRRNTIKAIKDFIPVMRKKGIVFCYASEL